jgi:hypothetical protein
MEITKMRAFADKLSRLVAVLGLAMVLLVPQMGYSQTVDEEPTALAMVGDLVLVRPVLLGITVIGVAAYVVSLPFSLAGGNATDAAKTLVVGPGEATFVRCLGCTKPGYKRSVSGE